jgi:hypothetical protein
MPNVRLHLQEASVRARGEDGRIHSVVNARGETISLDFVVTIFGEEHVWGSGVVQEIRGEVSGPHFARVLKDDGAGEEWINVDELSNINLRVRDQTLFS